MTTKMNQSQQCLKLLQKTIHMTLQIILFCVEYDTPLITINVIYHWHFPCVSRVYSVPKTPSTVTCNRCIGPCALFSFIHSMSLLIGSLQCRAIDSFRLIKSAYQYLIPIGRRSCFLNGYVEMTFLECDKKGSEKDCNGDCALAACGRS